MISQAKSQHENINSPMKQIYELFPEDPLKEGVTQFTKKNGKL